MTEKISLDLRWMYYEFDINKGMILSVQRS